MIPLPRPIFVPASLCENIQKLIFLLPESSIFKTGITSKKTGITSKTLDVIPEK